MLLEQNPSIETHKNHYLEYKKNTVSYKKRKQNFLKDQSAFNMFLKQRNKVEDLASQKFSLPPIDDNSKSPQLSSIKQLGD